MKKKLIMSIVLLIVLLTLLSLSVYAFITLGKKPIYNDIEVTTIPTIKEEFNAVTSKLLKKYDGTIIYDKNNTEIYEITSNEKYILGSSGKLYPDKIKYINNDNNLDNEILKFDRYEIRKDEDKDSNRLYYY